MEKINALIQQLCQLHASNAALKAIQPVVQQLHLAIEEETQPTPGKYSTQGSVSVWMPTPRMATTDGGGGSVPEPFPQPNPEPFPQPNPEPFPNPVPPEPNPSPEPVPEPSPQPQEPTTLPPAEPTMPTRLSFGVPRPPQHIFVESAELNPPEPLQTLHNMEVEQAQMADTEVNTTSIKEPDLPAIQDVVKGDAVSEIIAPKLIDTPVEPAVVQAVMAAAEEVPQSKAVGEEQNLNEQEKDIAAEPLSEWFVPPVIDWKLLEQKGKSANGVHVPLPEHQAWAGMEAEKQKEEATVVSRNVTPKDLSIDTQTLTDIDELIRGKKHSLPGKATELSELNDRLAERTRVLNESFSQHHEMAEMFSGPRITDLRKAISINEKYQYVNNLFRGDENMFERSVKTINNFRVMEEADFWVQRELVIKLGWNPDDELAQRFYSLVRRRFS